MIVGLTRARNSTVLYIFNSPDVKITDIKQIVTPLKIEDERERGGSKIPFGLTLIEIMRKDPDLIVGRYVRQNGVELEKLNQTWTYGGKQLEIEGQIDTSLPIDVIKTLNEVWIPEEPTIRN